MRILNDDKGFYINKIDGERIALNYVNGQYSPEDIKSKSGVKSKVNYLSAECPSWEVQREQLESIAVNNKTITVRHRGDSDVNIAENSLSAFRLSYKLCRAAIETDVLLTKDDQAVIFHDVRIGKMMEPDYNPDTNKGPNALLTDMTLAELKQKKLLDPRRKPTSDTIITVDELIDDYQKKNGQAIIYLEVKNPKLIIRVAKMITKHAESDPTILKRIVVKFNMAEFPTYVDWVAALMRAGADVNVMANPVMSPFAAERINKLPKDEIPIPEGDPLHDNASRAVYWWSYAHGTNVPNVEIVIKSTDNGFINKIKRKSPQG
ncbi:glycerophosphodiester phosphodiesterase family protein [Erwinia mallotivora]|uniref:glycerophosphodiester phosphodiesterase family protein n=1 Tax=Erwinia mallotivora TaxID=69222 RepID=UPI0035EF7700